MTFRRIYTVAAVLAALGLLLSNPGLAGAHAFLLRADPAPGSSVPAAPARVRLWFSEPVEVRGDGIAVTGASDERYDIGDAKVAPNDPREVLAGVRGLGRGTYTVRWRVVSADAHVVSGSYQFAVGSGTAAGGPAFEGAQQTAGGPFYGEALIRWVALISLAVLAGGFFFRQLVLVPALNGEGTEAAARGEAEAALVGAMRLGALGALLAAVLALVNQMVQVAGGELLPALNARTLSQVLLSSRFGAIWLARMVMIVGLFAVLDLLAASTPTAMGVRAGGVRSGPAARAVPPRGRGTSAFSWWAGCALGAGLAGTHSLISHAAGRDPAVLALGADWLHLLATAFWVGGIFHLAVLLFGPRLTGQAGLRDRVVQVLPVFSRLAAVAVPLLIATGMVSLWLGVGAPANLTTTDYGLVLLIKLALVVPLLVLGGYQLLRLVPALPGSEGGQAGGDGSRRATRSVLTLRSEAVLAVAVLLTVGVLASTPLPRPAQQAGPGEATALPAEPAEGLALAQGAGGHLVALRIAPAEPGPNTVRVRLQQDVGLPGEAEAVEVRAGIPGAPGSEVVTLSAKGEEFTGTVDMPAEGLWELEVRIRQQGGGTTATTFSLSLPLPTARQKLLAAKAAMDGLQFLKEHQDLRPAPGEEPVTTDYLYAAPDAAAYRVSNGTEGRLIGSTRFEKRPDGSWAKSEMPRELAYRFEFPYIDEHATEAALLGQEAVDGVESDILAYVLPDVGGYFKVWAGTGDRRIRRLEMAAPGHYMTSRYYDFDVPNNISAP